LVGLPPVLSCPACGTATAELLAGRELQIVSVRWEGGDGLATATPERNLQER
jgi:hydrogenase nickel incorporation protein HypA/HybF